MRPVSLKLARGWHRAVFYVKSLARGRQAARDLDEELRSHLELQIEDNRRRGMSEQDAYYAARRQFGALEANREECVDQRPTRWLEDMVSDLGIAFRSLRKRPLMTLVAILSLAIGIGSNSALFSVMDATLLHAVPLPDADRLIAIDECKKGERSNGNPPRTYDWGAMLPGLDAVYGAYGEQLVLTGYGDPAKLEGLRTCGDPLRTLNIQPELGRGFTALEQRGHGNVAMLSHEAWQHRFGAKQEIVGQPFRLEGKEYVVIGVLPAGVTYPSRAEV